MLASGWRARSRPTLALVILVILGLEGSVSGQGEGMVVSQHELASRLGAQVMAEGGNAIDAAITTAFVLAVTHPEAGNIGGGGFMVVRTAAGECTSFDFRECAPRRSSEGMFLDTSGHHDERAQHESHLSVGVPGTVAGLWLAHRRLGRLPWRRLVAPAVALARDGFPVDEDFQASILAAREKLERNAAARALFLPAGRPPARGSLFVQADLARTLAAIMESGARGFYQGPVAAALAAEMERGGGLIDAADLAAYEAIEREPIIGRYRGNKVVGMGPPSSGGATIQLMLGMLEHLPTEREPTNRVHLLAEVMRRAFAERARYLGAPETVDRAGLATMLDPERAAELAATIDLEKASVSKLEGLVVAQPEGDHTTHISVVDPELGAVALTYTIEEAWGSGIVVPGAGFLLNNEMGDFNPIPGVSTQDGLIGTPPNLVAPGKRMLSSMSPTIVLDSRDRPILVLGSPGGRTIINTVFLVLGDVIDLGMNMQDAVGAPRWHHGFLPDRIVMEEALVQGVDLERLAAMGHAMKILRRIGAAECIRLRHSRKGHRLEAGCDPRAPRGGSATAPSRRP